MLAWMPFLAAAWAEDAPAPAPSTAPTPAPSEAAAAPAPEATPVVSSAPSFVVFPVRAVNLSPGDVAAADALLRGHVAEVATEPLLSLDLTRGALTAGADDRALQDACARLSCGRWASVDLVQLGQDIYVTGILHDADGSILHRVDVVAPDVTALNASLHRVAEALVRRLPYAAITSSHGYTPTGTATPAVATPPAPGAAPDAPRPEKKRSVDSVQGFKIGTMFPLDARFGGALSLAYTGRWEKKERFLELSAGFALPLDDARAYVNASYLNVGYDFIFPTSEKIAFYAGAGGGPELVFYGDYGGLGVSVYGQGGVMYRRSGGLHLYGQVRLGVDMFSDLFTTGLYADGISAIEVGVGF